VCWHVNAQCVVQFLKVHPLLVFFYFFIYSNSEVIMQSGVLLLCKSDIH
jgi:hypothetical protein